MALRRYLVERRAGASRRGRCDACLRGPLEVDRGSAFVKLAIGADPGRKDVTLCEPCWSALRQTSDALDRTEEVTNADVVKQVY